jgi:hypothetical protein
MGLKIFGSNADSLARPGPCKPMKDDELNKTWSFPRSSFLSDGGAQTSSQASKPLSLAAAAASADVTAASAGAFLLLPWYLSFFLPRLHCLESSQRRARLLEDPRRLALVAAVSADPFPSCSARARASVARPQVSSVPAFSF